MGIIQITNAYLNCYDSKVNLLAFLKFVKDVLVAYFATGNYVAV